MAQKKHIMVDEDVKAVFDRLQEHNESPTQHAFVRDLLKMYIQQNNLQAPFHSIPERDTLQKL